MCGASETCDLLSVCVDKNYGYLLIVAVHYGSYLRTVKYLYKFVDQSSN